MSLIGSVLGVLSTVQIKLHTWRKGILVGVDSFGNKYYKCPPNRGLKRDRRWVLYKIGTDASQVPPEWHGWLHHQSDFIPGKGVRNKKRQKWQKPHVANMSGTKEAYHPSNPVLKEKKQSNGHDDYVSWIPPK